MTLQELITDLKSAGANENTIKLALNCYELGKAEAQAEQEPVAYIKAAELEELKQCNGMSLWAENAAVHTEDSISKQLLPSGHVPVYTTPPQRQPLTHEQRFDLLTKFEPHKNKWEAPAILIDMVEATHNIKE